MSESQNEDAKRRERARRVDALTDAARQPGEGPRLGTRIAGAVAVVALVAGATLGIGAWHSYQTEQDAKKQKAAAARKKQEAAARKSALETPSPSASEKHHKKTTEPTSSSQHRSGDADKADEVRKPKKTLKKPKSKVKLNNKMKMAGAGYSGIVLANQDSSQCADLPDFGPQRDGVAITQYPCNSSDGDNQLWNVTVSHPGAGADGGDLVMLANRKDGHCFDLPDGDGKPAGTHVNTANCNGRMDDNQQWRIEDVPNGNGAKKIHNFASKGLCLQVDGNSHTNDAPLIIGDCQAPSSNWFLRQ